ncbi:SMC-Scp complex subunit ScpB [Deinococcus aquiradiocola]|uniref:SMC-Scp complex subunit ScpB n=1 Tax=Deinococcus aquiradiocola TaxID=393059 RepID=UPI001E397692|nr:SMC-Scp complex subunit ScpB [Deinococcus aquiradiocola]
MAAPSGLNTAERQVRELLGAALLAAGRPLTLPELVSLLGLDAAGVEALVARYDAALQHLGAGFRVEAVGGGYRLVVPPERAALLSPIMAPPALPSLSGAALEVLAIIAYRQPVTRAEIEAMRGGSASTVLTLQERELVRVAGRSPAVGQPLLYATTARFLIEFGLNSLSELPELDAENFSGLLRG